METLESLKEFDALRISVASPEDVLSWSHGEVVKPETINYRTFKAEKDGLFDERIFGPTKDFECYCGKYKRIRYKGVICDKCGVEVTYSRVRRERMGHITLSTPCAHVWYFRGIPSPAGILLDVSPRELETVIYFASYLVVNFNPVHRAEAVSLLAKKELESKEKAEKETERKIKEREREVEKAIATLEISSADKNAMENKSRSLTMTARREISQLREALANELGKIEDRFKEWETYLKSVDYLTVIPEAKYNELSDYLDRFTKVAMGAEAVDQVLKAVDLDEIAKSLHRKLAKAIGPRRIKLAKRLRLVEGMRLAEVKAEWMITRHIAVIPPDLRPMVQLEGGRFATSDHNDLYRRVINRNNRLKKLLELGAPEIIIRNEKRMLQEAVDALIDSSKQHTQVRPMRGKQKLRSLSDLLKGKQGRFRRNLLGKRVDYSGRSVIVVGPHLKLEECGLPKDMALELFKPFVLREVMVRGLAPNLKSARYVLDSGSDEVWDILENIVKDHPVLLNRAPTLHRLGIQAFYPKLIDGYAIQLHPCVCGGYNADFDGDQMAVHIPLSDNARREANDIMLSSKNLLYPSSGVPITIPNREMLVGLHYLTTARPSSATGKIFADIEDALYSYEIGRVYLREPVKVRINGELIETTLGRIIFNSILPSAFEFFNDEINKENGALKKLVERSLLHEGRVRTVRLIDDFKNMGFRFSTVSGMSMAITDGKIPPQKYGIIEQSTMKAAEIDRNFRRGLITKREKLRLSEQVWTDATNTIDKLTWDNLEKDNPIKMMVSSGARGTRDMVKQIAGMRGLIVDPTGHLVELPIRSNYVEGLSGFEYFAGARGARKGLVDTALKTADAGYLTRRLVDVAQEVLVRIEDCGTAQSLEIIKGEETVLSNFLERVAGRVLAEEVKDASGKKVLFPAGTLVDEEIAGKIGAAGIERIFARSPMTCEAHYGVCASCYGRDLATKKLVLVGTAIGVTAAQSIGEPGTQLTLRTYHTGGIVGKDITQGLPRVEEVFEARNPSTLAVMADVTGRVQIVTEGESRRIVLTSADDNSRSQEFTYDIDPTAEILISEGDVVRPGQALTEGHLNLPRLVQVVGIEGTKKYIVSEIQRVYSTQGVNLNDKHVEVIVRQMFSRVRIDNPGDGKFLPGEIVSRYFFEDENERLLAEGRRPATAKIILLGITKASLATESFLAAASFQETTRVLTEAALSGKVDRLWGLKENVIIGRLIPTGERARIDRTL